ncbi:GNAT family N-acetyltransferase [Acetobacterium sp.]|uniref:GNAT family N-acetyltransferase n=1 Tax=Acetobacterium sp. TaxID=1872094 RepID=UPI002F41030E
MNDYFIRALRQEEIPLLSNFLYEAIFQRDERNLLLREVINQPELSAYIDGFGKEGDHCLVAECDGKVVGAVWTRIMAGEVKGFGNIDAATPEFAISLYKEYRNIGIGTNLMRSMLLLLKEYGYKQASLAVQKDNYAVTMYEKVGFEIIEELEQEYLMLCKLK